MRTSWFVHRRCDRLGPGFGDGRQREPGGPAGPVRPSIDPDEVSRLLTRSVEALGGQHRRGQEQMAHEVADAFTSGRHLLVQAGTGTGKSLAYLIPAMLAAQQTKRPSSWRRPRSPCSRSWSGVTCRCSPRRWPGVMPRPPTFAIFKGRSNYACLARVRDGVPDDQGVLVEAVPSGPLGREVIALREWAEDEASGGGEGDRDHAPTHGDRAWAQVSIQARECPGATNCAFGVECFAERSRAVAAKADVIVTNHALLAIDALEGIPLLPDYDLAVVDEGHELVARVTSAASLELAPGTVERAARRARPFATDDRDAVDDLVDASESLREALEALDGRTAEQARRGVAVRRRGRPRQRARSDVGDPERITGCRPDARPGQADGAGDGRSGAAGCGANRESVGVRRAVGAREHGVGR